MGEKEKFGRTASEGADDAMQTQGKRECVIFGTAKNPGRRAHSTM